MLPLIIETNKTAFMADKSILHNVLIGEDMVRLYTRRNISPRCLMKIDIPKAYDIVTWC